MVLVARALQASRCKDAGSPRTERTTWATEDAAARRSGAFWRHSHYFVRPSVHLSALTSFALKLEAPAMVGCGAS
jgi:hypothetical protein